MKNSYKNRVQWIAFVWAGILCLLPYGLLAESGAGYAVQPILPETQIAGVTGYYDLVLKPEQEETLEMRVYNRGDEDITVAIQANTAFTNANGVIEYSTRVMQRDPSMEFDFANLVSVEEPTLLVPANSSAIVPLIIQMPQEPITGELLGGILVNKVYDAQETGEYADQQSGVRNEFAYVVAVRIREEETKIEPTFEFTQARMEEIIGYPAMMLEIRNRQPKLYAKLAMDVRVVDQQERQQVLSFVNEVSMAPNTTMPFMKVLSDETKQLDPGTYDVHIFFTYQGETWHQQNTLLVAP